MGRAKELFLEYSWMLIVLIVIVGVLWQIGLFDGNRPRAAAAPDNPYIDFEPGEQIDIDGDHNVTCLNNHLPSGVSARYRNDTDRRRANFTHVEVRWRTDVVVQRTDRQQGAYPSQVRIHEDTIDGCDTDRTVEGWFVAQDLYKDVDDLKKVPCPRHVSGYEACYVSPWNSTYTTIGVNIREPVQYWHNSTVAVEDGGGSGAD